jgi:uncharacterized DUF497 family protein
MYVGVAVFSLDDKEFTWFEKKDRDNVKNHGLSLEEAAPVFLDPYLIVRYDDTHSSVSEVRWRGIGVLGNSLLLSIVFTEEQDNEIRLISAREASPKEKKDYYENIRQIFGT